MTDQPPSDPPPSASRRRRLAVRLGIAAAVVLAVLALALFVLPTPVARYVIEQQLEALGVEHDGIQTVRIDLWNSRVRAGPVLFRSGEAQQGQIGETGFDYSFSALVKRRAFVQIFYLRGVDIRIARLKDGTVEINGLNLQRIGADPEPSADKPPLAMEFGVERFEFTDSQLSFEDLTGGTANITLERLTLERLRSWAPDEPTTFTLEGRLNEMELSIDGTLLPLAEPLHVSLNSRIKGITLDRVTRFVGPSGLVKQAGTVDADARYDFDIHRDGRVAGTIAGTYRFADFDIATEAGETATVGEGVLTVDLKQTVAASGGVSVAGRLDLEAATLAVTTPVGDAVEVGKLTLALGDLDLEKGTEQRRGVLQFGTSPGDAAAEAGTAPSIIDLMVGWARELGINALKHVLEIDGRPTVKLRDARMRLAAREGAPGREIRFDALSVDLGKVVSKAFDAGWSVTAALDGAVDGLRLQTQESGPGAALPRLELGSRAVKIAVSTQATTLEFDLLASAKDLSASDGQGGSLALGGMSLASERIGVRQTADDGEASGPLRLDLEGFTASFPGAEGVTALTGEALALRLAPFSLSGKQALALEVDGDLELRGVSLQRDGPSPLSLELASTRAALQALRIAPLGAEATVEGDLSASLEGVTLALGKNDEAFSLAFESLGSTAKGLQASGFSSPEPNVSLSNHVTLRGLEAGLPVGDGHRANLTVAALDAPLSELGLAGAGVRAVGDVEATGISIKRVGKPAQSVDVASLSVTGLTGDTASGTAIERIAIGELKAAVTLPARAKAKAPASGAPESKKPAAGHKKGPTLPEKPIRIGELSLAKGSSVDITDGGVKPPLKTAIRIDALKLGPLDTAKPKGKTKLTLAATLNKKTKVSLGGWASPLEPDPGFDLKAKVEALSLPPLSTYAASAMGVNLESGVLSAGGEASASDGALAGKVDLRIDDLFVIPVSEKEAAELQANIGVPVGFAVSVLKNGDGVIAFGLPLSGTLDEPAIDYSEAVSKAIGGAMASMFPTSWFGPDGNTFNMQPATFVPGTTALTEEGRTVADKIGKLFEEKPKLSIRACGRAARADLLKMRTASVQPSTAPATQGQAPVPAPVAAGSSAEPSAAAADTPTPLISEPTATEVEALLALATARGEAIREFMEKQHGVAASRIPECRTAYSVEDEKAPRAEFQF